MYITVEQNRNDGNFHQVVIENVQEVLVKGSRVHLLQGEGVKHIIKCNAPLPAEAIKERIINGELYVSYEQRFVPLVPESLVAEHYDPYRVAANCLARVGSSIEELIQANPDAIQDIRSYFELGNLLRGKPAAINFKNFEKTFFIPYQMFKLGITPAQFWDCMQYRAVHTS